MVGGGGCLLSLSFMLQSLESRFLPAGTGGEVPSGRSLMGVSCGERASELGLPAPLPRSGPLALTNLSPLLPPNEQRRTHPSRGRRFSFLPSFPALASMPSSPGAPSPAVASRMQENTDLGPTLQSPRQKPRRQKARRLSPQPPCAPQASLPQATRVPSEAPPTTRL